MCLAHHDPRRNPQDASTHGGRGGVIKHHKRRSMGVTVVNGKTLVSWLRAASRDPELENWLDCHHCHTLVGHPPRAPHAIHPKPAGPLALHVCALHLTLHLTWPCTLQHPARLRVPKFMGLLVLWFAAVVAVYAVSLVMLQGMQGPLASLNM